MQRQEGETSRTEEGAGGAMADVSAPSVDRGSCCMLCSSQLYSAGFNIYQARTYHGEKSFYDKLIQLTNYTASLPHLASDCLCSVCATLLSQIDQLEFQLSHLVSQIRSLFHKMVQAQTEEAARQAQTQPQPQPQPQPQQSQALVEPQTQTQVQPQPQTETQPHQVPPPQQHAQQAPPQDQQSPPQAQTGPAGDPAGAPSELPAGPGPAFPAEVKTEPPTADHTPAFFDKRPAKENGEPSAAAAAGSAETARRPSWPAAPPPASGSSTEDGLFSIGHFLAPAAASSAGDFTDKFVREVESDDVYRFQCVLCGRLADCAEAIRQHVRRDHPGADRISFPGSAPAGRRGQSRAAPAVKAAGAAAASSAGKVPRSISASAAAMARNIAERAFVCAGCDKAFGCEAFLTRHVASQHCGRMFGCQFCGKEFSRSDKKVRHERSHTGERPFICSFCGKAFSRRDKCTYHERSHTKNRPLECQRCGEMLFTLAAYDSHRQRCTIDAQGTGPLWQTQPGQAAVVHVQAAQASVVDAGDA